MTNGEIYKKGGMRKVISKGLIWPLLIICAFGCVSWARVIPTLQNRTLEISRDFPGFYYEYKVCDKKFLGVCTKTKWHVDKYDLTDPKTREKLRNIGFKLRVFKT